MVHTWPGVEGVCWALVPSPRETGVVSGVHIAALARLKVTGGWIVSNIWTDNVHYLAHKVSYNVKIS